MEVKYTNLSAPVGPDINLVDNLLFAFIVELSDHLIKLETKLKAELVKLLLGESLTKSLKEEIPFETDCWHGVLLCKDLAIINSIWDRITELFQN